MASKSPDVYCLIRSAGMGDVVMALAAAKALKVLYGRPVLFGTNPKYARLARSCPHVDRVFSNNAEFQAAMAHYPEANVRVAKLDRSSFGIARCHQVDAYLREFEVEASPAIKDIDLPPDATAEHQVEQWLASLPDVAAGRARILLHPGAGDPNRTWPRAQWEALATQLIADGHQVIAIGHRSATPHRGVHSIGVDGLLSAVDLWDEQGTIAMMSKSHVLVSTDSGPVQLAGATNIGIIGLYSVAAGHNRLPFRHGAAAWRAIAVEPACAAYPCYQKLHDPLVSARFDDAIQRKTTDISTMFAEFCVIEDRYHCMTHEIDAAKVYAACRRLLATDSAR